MDTRSDGSIHLDQLLQTDHMDLRQGEDPCSLYILSSYEPLLTKQAYASARSEQHGLTGLRAQKL